MMYCPECKSENSDSAKFCKKCGKPLKPKTINHNSMINDISNQSSGNNTTKIIIIALIIIAVVLAGAFIYLNMNSSDNSSNSQDANAVNNNTQVSDNDEAAQSTQASQTSQSSQSTPQTTSMSILGGSFSTGSGLSDKTYASIYVGPQHSGEKVKVQIWYSRDGSTLNDGNLVPKTVDSSGYIDVASADAYKYYPDYAEINLYDNSGNLLDTQSVSLSPSSGTQSF